MDKSKVMKEVVSNILANRIKSFEDFISNTSDPTEVISAGLFALGVDKVDVVKDVDSIVFNYKYITGESGQLSFSFSNSHIDGFLANNVSRAVNLGIEIETNLSDAMMYPHDMRQKAIDSVCMSLGISDSFYSLVLKNWKTIC
ncbi:hypothetical protein [Teredinibacter turnerae]|uniref:hypothetical protein n=1 Tax=Teredinibacter turnerae TaxID=2426 RepID=UPI000490907C|nr:hypothetical protein [Teredinibacter turnerae]